MGGKSQVTFTTSQSPGPSQERGAMARAGQEPGVGLQELRLGLASLPWSWVPFNINLSEPPFSHLQNRSPLPGEVVVGSSTSESS